MINTILIWLIKKKEKIFKIQENAGDPRIDIKFCFSFIASFLKSFSESDISAPEIINNFSCVKLKISQILQYQYWNDFSFALFKVVT